MSDDIEPEPGEGRGAGILLTQQMHHVGVITQYIQALANVSAMQLPSEWMGYIVEGVRGRNTVGQTGVLKAVDRPPWKVNVMRVGFQKGMLHVEVMKHDRPFAVTKGGELVEAVEIPGVVSCQIVFRQSVPGSSALAACPWLFKKRSNDISVFPTGGIVLIAPAVVPQPEVMLEPRIAVAQHIVRELVQILGSVRADGTGCAAGDIGSPAARHQPLCWA